MPVSERRRQFLRGVRQFNAGKFFESHETWEEIWLSAEEPEKTFLHGIIQVAAAFHHAQRENLAGAQSLLRKGLAKLDSFPGNSYGIRLETLRAAVRRWIRALDAGESSGARSFPRIIGARRKSS